MTSQEAVRHTLSVAVRLDDHFLGDPIPDELDVRVDTYFLPTLVRGGNGYRHDDGTYRFLDLADGVHQVQVKAASGQWMLLDAIPAIVTPLAQPMLAMPVQVWPTPQQSTPLGMTSVRGKLLGSPAATIARRIDLDVAGIDSGYHTQASTLGEFLFLLPGRLDLDPVDGMVDLDLRVTGTTVTSGEIVAGEQTSPFSGAAFRIPPGRESRVRFFVT